MLLIISIVSMSIETQRKIIKLVTYAAGQFAFPLLSHKIESDRANKHENWSSKKHIALTGLAFIVDLGFDCQTAILFITENYREADMVKIAHVIGTNAIPETLTNLKNKAKHNWANRKRL